MEEYLNKVIQGDCLIKLKELEDNSIDSIVTDPPYHLVSIVKRFGKENSAPAKFGTDGAFSRASKGFMGKDWDGVNEDGIGIAQKVELWKECLRVLKPGGYLLAFGGTRTYHRMASAIEDAGFEVRDMIEWVYGSGFPKSLNIGKAVDKHGGVSVGWFGQWLRTWRKENNITQKQVSILFPSKTGGLTGCVANWELGLNIPTNEQFNLICKTFNLPFKSLEEAEREVVGLQKKAMSGWNMDGTTQFKDRDITKGTSEWEGWGTALKPAHEPICMARKPLTEKTVAENCLKWGTGGINIDESRVALAGEWDKGTMGTFRKAYDDPNKTYDGTKGNVSFGGDKLRADRDVVEKYGRFPANLIHDNSEEVRECFPESKSGKNGKGKHYASIGYGGSDVQFETQEYGDSGNASRFFKSIIYQAKASKTERNRGCEEFETKQSVGGGGGIGNYLNDVNSASGKFGSEKAPAKNNHPTVKPIALMEYLIKLVSREGHTILDPFMGSGSTGIACKKLNRHFIGIELDENYFKIAKERIENTPNKLSLN